MCWQIYFSIVIMVLNFGLLKFANRLVVKRAPLEKHN